MFALLDAIYWLYKYKKNTIRYGMTSIGKNVEIYNSISLYNFLKLSIFNISSIIFEIFRKYFIVRFGACEREREEV